MHYNLVSVSNWCQKHDQHDINHFPAAVWQSAVSLCGGKLRRSSKGHFQRQISHFYDSMDGRGKKIHEGYDDLFLNSGWKSSRRRGVQGKEKLRDRVRKWGRGGRHAAFMCVARVRGWLRFIASLNTTLPVVFAYLYFHWEPAWVMHTAKRELF